MRSRKRCISLFGALFGLSIAISVIAQPDNSKPLSGLEGRIFSVEAEILQTADEGSTGPVGLTFNNCYYFNEDGEWVDPLFPDPSGNFVVPGVWVQHTEHKKISTPQLYLSQMPVCC